MGTPTEGRTTLRGSRTLVSRSGRVGRVPESVDLPLRPLGCVANRYLWAVRSSGEGWLVEELPSQWSVRRFAQGVPEEARIGK
jgi:hypothetical protein